MVEIFRDAEIEPDWHRIGEKLRHHGLDQSASECGGDTGDCDCDCIAKHVFYTFY